MAGPTHDFARPSPFAAGEGSARARVAQAGSEADASLRVGVIYNPRSHRNRGQDLDVATRPNIFVAQPRERSELPGVLEDFARRGIDYLVINGGDGTVRDVLSSGHHVYGENWPRLAVLPKGKTNALNVDLGAPADWNLVDALEAIGRGHVVTRRPVTIGPVSGTGPTIHGFILGAGAFTIGIRAGQDAHRYGAFNSLAVAVTAFWGVAQALFGSDSNIWRRGIGMRIRLDAELRDMAHSGHGDPARRELLFASTLERFPAGLKPFGPEKRGLKLTVIDKPRRRIVGMLPLVVLAGYRPRWLYRAGLHQLGADSFEIELDDQFILDGEAFPAGHYRVEQGPALDFIVP